MSFTDYRHCDNEFSYKEVQFHGYSTPEILDGVCQFEFLPTDIVLSTFPRSGTTFTQEIIWQIKNRKFIHLDEKIENIFLRFPFLEFNHEAFPIIPDSFINILNRQRKSEYRLIKTHVPFKFIKENFEKPNPKMIVVMRSPKDCLVSNYYHYIGVPFHGWKGTFDEFFPIFLNGKTASGCYFDNNLEWWALRHQKNILILFYEDILNNLKENVLKIATFMGDELTEEELHKIVHNSTFSTMYNNSKMNISFDGKHKFIRKGVIGDWKNHFSNEQSQLIDEKVKEKFRGTDLAARFDS